MDGKRNEFRDEIVLDMSQAVFVDFEDAACDEEEYSERANLNDEPPEDQDNVVEADEGVEDCQVDGSGLLGLIAQ